MNVLRIGHDERMNRHYIPIPGGWEIQTKGNGSSFRICDTKTGERMLICDERLHAPLEKMAREAHAAWIELVHPQWEKLLIEKIVLWLRKSREHPASCIPLALVDDEPSYLIEQGYFTRETDLSHLVPTAKALALLDQGAEGG